MYFKKKIFEIKTSGETWKLQASMVKALLSDL